MSSFASFIKNFLLDLAGYFKDAWEFIYEFVLYAGKWIFDQVLNVIDFCFASIPSIPFISTMWDSFGDLPEGTIAFLGAVKILDCFGVIFLAYLIKNILRLIPVVRLGS